MERLIPMHEFLTRRKRKKKCIKQNKTNPHTNPNPNPNWKWLTTPSDTEDNGFRAKTTEISGKRRMPISEANSGRNVLCGCSRRWQCENGIGKLRENYN